MTTRVGIIFGGRSGEHEVSLLSARSIFQALDRTRHEPVLLGVDKQGVWRLGGGDAFFQNPTDPRRVALDASAPAVVAQAEGPGRPVAIRDVATGAVRAHVDVFFPIMHGTFGEDGSLQGLLRLLDVPFVGPSVLGSAVGMDKDVMKRLLRDAGIPVARFVTLRSAEGDLAGAVAHLGFPLFVKPANLGSSVGIRKVTGPGELAAAVRHALRYDHKVVVEESVTAREIEVAVLGNQHPEPSICGEIVPSHDFYSYEAKYVDDQGALLRIPAPIDPAVASDIRNLAVKTFRVLDCEGLGRVDFFLRPDGEALVNEINTLPGFTKVSMYPKLWEATGLPYPALLDRLIELARERHGRESALLRSAEP